MVYGVTNKCWFYDHEKLSRCTRHLGYLDTEQNPEVHNIRRVVDRFRCRRSLFK